MAKIIKLKLTFFNRIKRLWRIYGQNVRRRMDYLERKSKED